MRISSKKRDLQFDQYRTGQYHNLLLTEAASNNYDIEMSIADAIKSAAEADAAEEAQKLMDLEAERNKHRSASASPAAAPPSWCKRPSEPLKKGFFSDTYSAAAIHAALARANARSVKDKHDKKRLIDTLELYQLMGGRRPLAAPPLDWRLRLDRLRDDMPNFQSAIDYLRAEFALAAAADVAPRLSPMLLDGPPGVGKTTFARALAELLGSGFLGVSMETAQTASNLTGSEEYWGNSRTGLLFSLLVNEQFANPVVLVDEVEKANDRGGAGYDPAAALYSLLEPTSAAKWHDLSIPDLQLDASRVIWILTSNSKKRLPQPLLSRMRVFDVPGLTAEQSLATAKRIFAGVVHDLNLEFDESISGEVAEALAAASPREMHRMSRELVAKAVLNARKAVVRDDLIGLEVAGHNKAPSTNKLGAVVRMSLAVGVVETTDGAVGTFDGDPEAEESDPLTLFQNDKKPTLH